MRIETENALRDILETAVQTKDFVLEQAPDVIHQLLLFTTAESVFMVLLSLVPIFISYKASFKWTDQTRDSTGDFRDEKMGSIILGSIVSIPSCVVIAVNIITLLKVLIAPKLFILEYAAELVS